MKDDVEEKNNSANTMKSKDEHYTSVEKMRADERKQVAGHREAQATENESVDRVAEVDDSAESHEALAEGLNDKKQGLEERVRSLEDSLLRAKADYQNLQRRTANERAEAIKYANADLMRSLVGVMDDFERALLSAEGLGNLDAVVEGIRLVYENLRKALKEAGLEAIDALHQPFDPSVHDALMQQPSDEYAPGTVVEQVAPGYRLRDRVIRPAKVIVAKATE